MDKGVHIGFKTGGNMTGATPKKDAQAGHPFPTAPSKKLASNAFTKASLQRPPGMGDCNAPDVA